MTEPAKGMTLSMDEVELCNVIRRAVNSDTAFILDDITFYADSNAVTIHIRRDDG